MNEAGQLEKLETQYVELFEENYRHLTQGATPAINAFREKGIEAFKRLGIPSFKQEDYRYTNLQNAFEGNFQHDFSHELFTQELEELFHCEVPDLHTYTIYLINGWYYRRNEIADTLPDGVLIGSLEQMSKEYPEIFETYYGKAARMDKDGTVALNTAFVQDGVFVYVPKGVVVEKPIQLVNILTADSDSMSNGRNLIVLEENAQATIMVCDHTLTNNKFVSNLVSEVFVGKNSVFDIYSVQNQHNLTTSVASLFVRQKANSKVLTNNLTLHTGVTRNNVYVTMEEAHCESNVYGLYLCDKNQHVDNFSFIDHASPSCYSNELFKGVLDDRATAAFSGKIMVRPDAQQTNAFQRNNNLLLTQDAKVNTKPQLEIYADDVKCSHGATVGQLDEEALFYMKARGVGNEEARILLMYAFAFEVIEKIRVKPLQDQIRELVEKVFRGELNKCHSCVVCGQLGTKATCV